MNEKDLSDLLSMKMMDLFRKGARILRDDPGMIPFAFRILKDQKKAVGIRKDLLSKDLHVPPFMIISVTNRCNLDCKGCYARKFQNASKEEMSGEFLRNLLGQARDLGISIVMIAGGEPLIRKDILDIMKDYPEIIFPLFTNGILLDEEIIERLRSSRHIIPVLSFEGFGPRTNMRRGEGVFELLMDTAEKLGQARLFWGISLTVTRSNFEEVTDPEFIGMASKRGCRLYFFVEYIPVAEGSECEVPTQEQRGRTVPITEELEKRFPGIFIAFPGDEEIFGGCLSSGRGFVHVNPQGELRTLSVRSLFGYKFEGYEP